MSVGLAICGAGYMGRRMIIAAGVANEILRAAGPDAALSLEFVVDPRHEALDNVHLWVGGGGLYRDLHLHHLPTADFIKKHLNSTKRGPEIKTVLYDSGPASSHQEHAALVLRLSHATYLGEKPLAIDEASLEFIKKTPGVTTRLFTDLIETKSLAFLTLREHLANIGGTITKFRARRFGGTYFKHLLRRSRSGVEGGALYDKVVHDLAIMACLVAQDEASLRDASLEWRSVTPGPACFASPIEAARENPTEIAWLGIDGAPLLINGPMEWRFIATSFVDLDGVIRIRGQEIKVEMSGSWVGIPDHHRELADEIPADWRTTDQATDEGEYTTPFQEVRVVELELEGTTDGTRQIVVNFHQESRFGPMIQATNDKGETRQVLIPQRPGGNNSLARTLASVAISAGNIPPASLQSLGPSWHLGSVVTIAVHQWIAAAQNKIAERTRDNRDKVLTDARSIVAAIKRN